MNSRVLINDLFTHGIENGLEVKVNCEVTKIDEEADRVKVSTLDKNI